MKKKLLTAVLAGAMLFSLAACGDASGDNAADGGAEMEEDTSADNHTLTVYAWDASFNIPALEAAEEDYQTNVDPDFVLEIVEQSGSTDVETLITNVASAGEDSYNQLPDIVLFQDHYFEQYLDDYPDVWQDINDADIEWDSFAQEKLSYSTIDGIHYGVPVDSGTCVAAYRVDLLEEAGYSIDDLTGVTWNEFMNIGEDVYNQTGKYLLGVHSDSDFLIYVMLQAEGGSMFKDGEPNITGNDLLTELIELQAEMVERKVLFLSNIGDDYYNAIQTDQVAGVINGNWIIPTIESVDENTGLWEITSLPTLSGEEGYASNGGASLYITANCSDYDLAVNFLSYTFGGGSYEETGTSITYDKALTDGGVVTTYIPAGESDVYSEGVAYFNDTPIYAEIAEMTASIKTIEQNPYHYTAIEQMGTALVNIINGTDTDTALSDAESQLRYSMGLE